MAWQITRWKTFLVYDNTKGCRRIGFYNEREAAVSGVVVENGYELMERLLGE